MGANGSEWDWFGAVDGMKLFIGRIPKKLDIFLFIEQPHCLNCDASDEYDEL